LAQLDDERVAAATDHAPVALRRIRAFLAALTLLAAACAPNQTPSPSPSPSEAAASNGPVASEPVAEASPSANPGPSQGAGDPPANSTSADLITAAVANGTIDEATGYVYRFYAQWFDPRLPDAYRGASGDDADLVALAQAAFDSLTPDDQARLRPFLVRPRDAGSYFNEPQVTAATARISLASAAGGSTGIPVAQAPSDPRCDELHFVENEVPGIPVTVWGRCYEHSGAYTYDVETDVAEVMVFIADLYPKEVALMGRPIGDQFKDPAHPEYEVSEAGDGRIDIYVVKGRFTPYDRLLENEHKAITYPAEPKVNGTSSAYIVYDGAKAGGTVDARKANLAHEFFHVLQDKYNQAGRISCPYPNVTGTCSDRDRTSHWFSEASAAWAEHYFVQTQEGREPDYVHFRSFLATDWSLSETKDLNGYRSWVWPLFMEQETAPQAIANVWRSLLGKRGWQAVQQVVSDALPFEDHFRDFAVRVWQEKLDGDPFRRFQDKWPGFPPTTPRDVDAINAHFTNLGLPPPQDPIPRFKGFVDIKAGETKNFTEDIPELWADYYDISPDTPTRRLEFVFSGLSPRTAVDVDVLLRIDDKWEHRPLSGAGTIQFCLDKPADAIQQLILVLSNHEMDPNKHVTGRWNVWADDHGCLTGGDGLTFESTYTVGAPDADWYSVTRETLSVTVKLKAGFGGAPNAIPFLNDNSTYTATYSDHSVLKGIGGCSTITDTTGAGGGTIPGDDGVVSWVMQNDDGSWFMSVATGGDVQTTTTQTSCLGSYTDNGSRGISFPVCDGQEVAGSNHTKFKFNCIHHGEWEWSLTGTLTVHL
jgi:hypothetical protein